MEEPGSERRNRTSLLRLCLAAKCSRVSLGSQSVRCVSMVIMIKKSLVGTLNKHPSIR